MRLLLSIPPGTFFAITAACLKKKIIRAFVTNSVSALTVR